jgi:hypothetical protein
MIRLVLAAAVLLQAPRDTKVPHLDDETSLVRIKANPEKYLGKAVTICGGLMVDDYYNDSYDGAEKTHFSLRFMESGETLGSPGDEFARLYLPRDHGQVIIDQIVETEVKNKRRMYKLARVKVLIQPERYRRDKQWNMMEVVDVQFATKDFKDWNEWQIELERRKKEAEEAASEARRKLKQAELEEKKASQREREAESEAAKWRDWTGTDGNKFRAKYGGAVGGEVKLLRENEKEVKLKISTLPKEEREWIEKKKWLDNKS